MADDIDYLRDQKRRLGGTPERFTIIELVGKPGVQFSVETVHGPERGLWSSVSACEIDDIHGQQCSDMRVIAIGAIQRIISF